MKCQTCGKPIPQSRLDILPYTTTCVSCSTEQRKISVQIAESKSTRSLLFVDSSDGNLESYAHQENSRGFMNLSSAGSHGQGHDGKRHFVTRKVACPAPVRSGFVVNDEVLGCVKEEIDRAGRIKIISEENGF